MATPTDPPAAADWPHRPRRPRLVVLGTGWGGARLARDIDTSKWDLTVISPRNHLVFTPLLGACQLNRPRVPGFMSGRRAALRRPAGCCCRGALQSCCPAWHADAACRPACRPAAPAASTCVGTVEARSVTVPIVDVQPALKQPQVRRWTQGRRPPGGCSRAAGAVPALSQPFPRHRSRNVNSLVFPSPDRKELLLRGQRDQGAPRRQAGGVLLGWVGWAGGLPAGRRRAPRLPYLSAPSPQSRNASLASSTEAPPLVVLQTTACAFLWSTTPWPSPPAPRQGRPAAAGLVPVGFAAAALPGWTVHGVPAV